MKSNVMRLVSALLVVAMLAAMPVVAFADADGWHEHNKWNQEESEVYAPDCNEEEDDYSGSGTGYTYRVCAVCGYEEEVEHKHAFHKYALDVDEDGDIMYVEPGEDEDGHIGYWKLVCSECEDTITVLDHNNVGASGNYKSGHNMVEYTKQPTCVDYGFKIYRCNSAGCEYEQGATLLAPTGHSWVQDEGGNTWITISDATSTMAGAKKRVCRICGHEDTTSTAWTKPANDEATIIAEYAKVYADHSTSSTVEGVVLKGSKFTVLSSTEDGTWKRIKAVKNNGESGGAEEVWISASSIMLASSSKSGSAYAGALRYGVVTGASSYKIHSAPNDASATTKSLTKNTEVFVYEISGDFLRISATENKWIKKNEVSLYSIKLGNAILKGTDNAKYDVNDAAYVDKKVPAMEDASNTAATPSVVATGVVQTNTPLNVRSEAQISILNVVGSLVNGTKVDITKIKEVNGHDWGRITYKGETAWICLDYVTVTSTTSTPATNASGAVLNAKIVNCATAANVRKTPGTSGTLIGTVPVGSRVAVTKFDVDSAKNRWAYVDKKGWIIMEYVSLDPGAEDAIKGATSNTESALPTYTKVSVPAVVSATSADLMSMPTTSSPSKKLMTVYADANKVLTITERSTDGGTTWCKVTIGTTTGWLDQSKLTMKNVVATSAVDGLNVYAAANIDSAIKMTLAVGSPITITDQVTDGTYVWGKIDTNQYVRMDQLTSIIDSSKAPNTVKTVSISGKVTADVNMTKEAGTGTTLLTLVKDKTVTITDLKSDTSGNYGKVTVGEYTGWIDLSKVEQTEIKGTVYSDSVNVYSAPGTGTVERILRKGQNINVQKRIALGREIWGQFRLNGTNYWCSLNGVLLAGETAPSTSTGTTTAPSTGTTTTPTVTPPAVSSTAPGTIVNCKAVNVREAAGVGNKLVTTLNAGSKVTVYEQQSVGNAMWCRIDQGWISKEYVDLSNRPTTATSPITGGTIMTSVPSGSVAVGFVNIADLTVRTGAGQSYAKVATLPKSTNVVIHEQVLKDGMIWGRIDQGWICTSYVTLTATSVTGSGTSGLIKGCFYTANVRSAPGVGNALVGKVMVNSQVEILEQKEYAGEMWGRTSVGWIAMQYVLTGSVPAI